MPTVDPMAAVDGLPPIIDLCPLLVTGRIARKQSMGLDFDAKKWERSAEDEKGQGRLHYGWELVEDGKPTGILFPSEFANNHIEDY